MKKTTALLLAALVGALAPTAARADKLDARLIQEGPKLAQKLIDKKYANVGVLRFEVEAPGIKPNYTSPLSGTMATRLETGLILHAERDGKPAYGVTRDVSAVAQKAKVGAWPTSVAERKKLLAGDYPLAWGKSKVKADAFVTGKVKVSKDMKETTVTILAFDKATPGKFDKLTEFTMPTDSGILRDLGISYALPRSVRARALKRPKGSARGDEIDTDAVEIVGQQQQTETLDKDGEKDGEKPQPKIKQDTGSSPSDIGGIKVRLLADGMDQIIRESPTQGDGVKWQVESPRPGQKIAFELTNTSSKKLGVVLRINGVNLVNEQTRDPETCGKVILAPGKTATITGFYKVAEAEGAEPRGKPRRRDGEEGDDKPPVPDGGGDDKAGKLVVVPFKILVGEQASAMRAEIGDKAGLIDIDVYEIGNMEPQAQATQRGLPPSKALKARETYKGLKTALLQSSGLKTKVEPRTTGGVASRELIVPDVAAATEIVKGSVTEFPNPLYVSRVTIKVVPAEAAP